MPILHLMSPENLQFSKPNQTGSVFPKNISGISRISYVRWTNKKSKYPVESYVYFRSHEVSLGSRLKRPKIVTVNLEY